jgi:hypothetical protein
VDRVAIGAEPEVAPAPLPLPDASAPGWSDTQLEAEASGPETTPVEALPSVAKDEPVHLQALVPEALHERVLSNESAVPAELPVQAAEADVPLEPVPAPALPQEPAPTVWAETALRGRRGTGTGRARVDW